MRQCTLFNYDKHDEKIIKPASIPQAPAPVKKPVIETKITQTAASPKAIYDTDYLCKLISKDLAIFDIRSWPRGINRKEFDNLWETDFINGVDEYFFAGHFAFAVREAKRLFCADKEKVWESLLKFKKQQLEEWIKIYRRDADWEWKTANSSNTPEDVEHWLECCHLTWSNLNAVLKELGKPEEPLPEKHGLAFCDPLKWGEEKKSEKIKNKRRKIKHEDNEESCQCAANCQ